MATFRDGDSRDSLMFDQWLTESATLPDARARNERLARWSQAPRARACHPREEHLLPLMVAAGAAGDDPGRLAFTDLIGGKQLSGYAFG
jgi:aromatic ring-opening dioxygenase catalytic subunit (LigB family)